MFKCSHLAALRPLPVCRGRSLGAPAPCSSLGGPPPLLALGRSLRSRRATVGAASLRSGAAVAGGALQSVGFAALLPRVPRPFLSADAPPCASTRSLRSLVPALGGAPALLFVTSLPYTHAGHDDNEVVIRYSLTAKPPARAPSVGR